MTNDASKTEKRYQLIYVADPMCSWCWGFSPVIREVHERLTPISDLRVIMGGLRAGNTQPMDDGMATYISSAWDSVEHRTGATFNRAFFDREGFVYDTEPACRAVVTLRETGVSGARLLAFMAAVQKAFYAHNRDTTDTAVLADIAQETGHDRDNVLKLITSDAMREKTQIDFMTANQSGITGFPTVLFGTPEGYHPLTTGYRALEELTPILDQLTAQSGSQ